MDEGSLLFYVAPLLVSAAFGLFLALYISRKRPVPGSRALMALILGASLWAAGYALEFLSPGLDSKIFWAKFQYFGIATIPLLWLIFADRRMGTPEWMAHWSRYLWLLAVIPLFTLILVWTNELHGLVWSNVQLHSIGSGQVLGIEHGPWFWFYILFSYTLLLVGSVWLVGGMVGKSRLYRWQTILVTTAVLIPFIGNLLYITPLNPIEYFDWTPFAFLIAGLLLTVSLFRFQFANLVPIAQRSVFAGLTDCVFVLDIEDRIEDLNLAARQKMVLPGLDPLGRPVAEVAPALARYLAQATLNEEFRAEFTDGEGSDIRFHDLRISPLHGSSDRPVGRLVVCHEITHYKQEQARLHLAQQELERAVAERTEELRLTIEQLTALAIRLQQVQELERNQIASDLHDCIGQNLAALNLNLQIIENEQNGASEAARRRLRDSLELVEETTRQVRNLMTDLHPPVLDEFGLVAALKWYAHNYSQRSGIAVSVVENNLDTYLTHDQELVLFRVVQEALNNVLKHAQATQVEITLEACEESTRLGVRDNGQGFDPATLHALDDEPHWGLISIEQRVTSIDGQLTIDSAPNEGTIVSVLIQR